MSSMWCSMGVILFLMTSWSFMASYAADQHVAQVKIYVDRGAEDNWRKVTGQSQHGDFWRDMNSTFFEINEVYKTLKSNGVDLQLQIHDVVFLNKNILNTNNGKIITSTSAKQFADYVKGSYSNDKFDLAVLYTGANLVNEDWSDGTYGYAYIGTVCSAMGVGVIELKATYMDALATSHEMGHIFGSHHDGTQYASQCASNSGEIMNAVTEQKAPKHFFFSSCSARQIKATIDKLNNKNNNCMKSWSASNNIKGPRYGSLATPDQFCQREYGSGSYVARKAYKSYGNDVCVHLACMTKTVGTYFQWSFVATPQGLKCGTNKQCIQGKCVKTPSGSASVSDTCPFGDQPKIEGDYQMTCADVTPSMCSGWKNTCCQTCGSGPGTADDVCKRLKGQNSAMARLYYANSYGDKLCSKLACLRETKGKTFYWDIFTAPDGMNCGKSKRCSKGKCVASKMGDPSMSDSCPYGDQPFLAGDWQRTCADQANQYGCDASGWKETCCASCVDPGTADEICVGLVGKSSSLARLAYDGDYGDKLCSKLACTTASTDSRFHWNFFKAPDGMKCGKSKRCSKGKCVYSRTGDPNMSSSCPYGDQPYLEGNLHGTCKNFIRDKRNTCDYDRFWRKACCASCA